MAEQSPIDPSQNNELRYSSEAKENLALLLGDSLGLARGPVVEAVGNLATHLENLGSEDKQLLSERLLEIGALLGPLAAKNFEPARGRVVNFDADLNELNNQRAREKYGDAVRTVTILPDALLDIDGMIKPLNTLKNTFKSTAVRRLLFGTLIDLRGEYVKFNEIRQRMNIDVTNTPAQTLSEYLLDADGQPIVQTVAVTAKLKLYGIAPDVVIIDGQDREPIVTPELPKRRKRKAKPSKPPIRLPAIEDLPPDNVIPLPLQKAQEEQAELVPHSETIPLSVSLKKFSELFMFSRSETRALRYHFDEVPTPKPAEEEVQDVLVDVRAAFDFIKEFDTDNLTPDELIVMDLLLGADGTTPLTLVAASERLDESGEGSSKDIATTVSNVIQKLIKTRQSVFDSAGQQG